MLFTAPKSLMLSNNTVVFITFFVVMVLQVRSIESAKKIEDIDYCLNTYFLYKYKILE